MSGTKLVLTLGMAGEGKSTVLNEAMGSNKFDTARGVGHCTTDVAIANLAPGVDVVNVPGLFGVSSTMTEWLEQVNRKIQGKNIAVLLLVNRADSRGSLFTRMLIGAIDKFFHSFDVKKIICVFTHCDVVVRENGPAELDRLVADWVKFLETSPHLNNLGPNVVKFSRGQGQGPALKRKIVSLAGRQQKAMTFNKAPNLMEVGRRLVKDAGIPMEVVKAATGGDSCFGADTHVECRVNEAVSVKSIRDVQVGDLLRVDADGGFAPVVARAHYGYDKDVEVPLVRITFESGSIVATPDHLLLVPGPVDSDPVPHNIGSLVAGDSIYLATDHLHGLQITTVLSVEEIWGCRRSIITKTGTVVVNSVQASVFMGHPDNHYRLKAILDIGMGIDSVFPGFLSSPRLEGAREWFFQNCLYPFGDKWAPRDQIDWHAPTVSELITKMAKEFTKGALQYGVQAMYTMTSALNIFAFQKGEELSDIVDSTLPANEKKMPECTPFVKA